MSILCNKLSLLELLLAKCFFVFFFSANNSIIREKREKINEIRSYKNKSIFYEDTSEGKIVLVVVMMGVAISDARTDSF